MREHLFRGRRKGNGEWIEGGYCHKKVGEYLTEVYIVEARTDGMLAHYRVDPETVGDFTNMHDEHGRWIFEGDVCQAQNMLHGAEVWMYTVAWHENGFYFMDEDGSAWHPDHLEEIEVIGNIHDNPEFMEVRDGKEVQMGCVGF